MERMWRKVNHSFSGRTSKTISSIQSTDTVSSAGGFGDGQVVVAVAGIPAHNSNAGGGVGTGANLPSSTATGRRLAASGQLPVPGAGGQLAVTSPGNYQKSLSQHVLQSSTASSERRRRRRRKSRPRRNGGISCVGGGGGGDNMSSSGGFYSIRESSGGRNHRRHHHQQHHHQHPQQQQQQPSSGQVMASSAPSGTVMMHHHPNLSREASTVTSGAAAVAVPVTAAAQTEVATTSASAGVPDISLRQRAVAKLRMFNFHLNWDLHMTHCKPCGPRLGSGGGGTSGGGNIITRRLCRNRRREDNELYRSNSFKFERFERKDCLDELADTLQKQIAICDDYSLPVDFVKKRPSSFDPNLAEAIPTNPENWTAPSPQSEFIVLADPHLQQQQQQQSQQQQQQQYQHPQQQIPLPPPPPPSTAAASNVKLVGLTAISVASSTLPGQTQQHQQHQQQRQHSIQLKTHNQRRIHQQQQQIPPLSTAIKTASVKLIEGYSDPKDSKRQKKVYHKKLKRRHRNSNNKKQTPQQQQQQQHIEQQQRQQQQLQIQQQQQQIQQQQQLQLKQQQQPQQQQQPIQQQKQPLQPQPGQAVKQVGGISNNTSGGHQEKHSTYSSDSSAPKSSDDQELDEADVELGVQKQCAKLPELNSPDSISDDLVRPLPPHALHRSPRKLSAGPSDTSKRNPSPYYYSDLLKPKEVPVVPKETKLKSRQSTVSEPPQETHIYAPIGAYRKSTSLDVPSHVDIEDRAEDTEEGDEAEAEDNEIENANGNDYDENDEDDEFEEETEPTTHNTVLAANSSPKRYSFTEDGVRIIRCDSPSTSTSDDSDCSECQKRREWHAKALALVRKTCNVQPLISVANKTACDLEALKFAPFDSENSMPPHRLLGPAVCACVTPAIGDDIDDYFRPRSIFYVHPHGVHECADCSADSKCFNSSAASRSASDVASHAQSDNVLDRVYDNEDDMAGRRRQIYETAFDCKIAKSDDDLDEVDRITNHSVLLQLNNGNNLPAKGSETRSTKATHVKSRLEGKRLKNSKNQAIQEKASNSGSNLSGNGSPQRTSVDNSVPGPVDPVDGCVSGLSTKLENVHLCDQQVDQQNNSTTSTSQLPMRGYTPSPPSTAPLPMKFPGKHERFFMNSIKSAPNLPSTNPAHPRLRDLRLPIQSSLRQQQQLGGSSLGTSHENSLTDSAYANPPSYAHHLPTKSTSRARDRPRSFVLESGRVLELRKSHAAHHHHVGNGGRRHHNYSSTESIATSSSGGSMESLRSSTSEGNRSTSSSESRHSTSLSSHSSESGSSSAAFPLRAPVVIHSKLHILSPISDKSSQEPASEMSEQNKTHNTTPEEAAQNHAQSTANSENMRPNAPIQIDPLKRRRAPPNKTLMHLADEILGSDSGISLHSREDAKTVALTTGQKFTLPKLNFPSSDKANDSGVSAVGGIGGSVGLPQDLRDLPFDMPKLRRRKTIQQDACTSGSATSVDLGDLPFDMPKLRRRLRANQVEINNLMVHSTESSGISQASSSHSMREENKANMKLDSAIFRQNLTLNLNEPRPANKFGSLDLRGMSSNKELNLNLAVASGVDLIDVSIPLERQGWYHGAITRIEAETMLRPLSEGSFLVRNCESTKQDYSLSLKGAKGFMHMRIQRNDAGQYILGQFSRPFDTVSEMIRHFCLNRLPVRGAEHMCLIEPVIAQLL